MLSWASLENFTPKLIGKEVKRNQPHSSMIYKIYTPILSSVAVCQEGAMTTIAANSGARDHRFHRAGFP